MPNSYFFSTPKGVFRVARQFSGNWRTYFNDEDLGDYDDPRQAAYELANDETFAPSCGPASELDVPESLDDWQPGP